MCIRAQILFARLQPSGQMYDRVEHDIGHGCQCLARGDAGEDADRHHSGGARGVQIVE